MVLKVIFHNVYSVQAFKNNAKIFKWIHIMKSIVIMQSKYLQSSS